MKKMVIDRIRIEGRALRETFSFQPDNSDMKKFLTFVLVITWATITAGIAFQEAQVTPTYSMLTALIWALVGRIWGGNVKDVTGGYDGGE